MRFLRRGEEWAFAIVGTNQWTARLQVRSEGELGLVWETSSTRLSTPITAQGQVIQNFTHPIFQVTRFCRWRKDRIPLVIGLLQDLIEYKDSLTHYFPTFAGLELLKLGFLPPAENPAPRLAPQPG